MSNVADLPNPDFTDSNLPDNSAKIESHNDESSAPKNPNNSTNNERKEYEKFKFYYRFLFPSKFTGLVVGKGGSRVKELREAHNIDIFIKETKGPERLIRFKSDSAEVIGDCMKDISTAWMEKMRNDVVTKLKEDQTEVRLVCHKTQVGGLSSSSFSVSPFPSPLFCPYFFITSHNSPVSSFRLAASSAKEAKESNPSAPNTTA